MYSKTNSHSSLLSNSLNWPRKKHFAFFFRVGYLSIALVYALTGYLALAAAMGWGGRITDHEGALEIILGFPYGRPILLVIALGICGYVAFRFAQALWNVEGKPNNFSGIGQRLYEGGSGLMYSLLAWTSFRGFLTHDIPQEANREEQASAEVMAWEGGDYLLFFLAVGLLAASLYQIYKGLTGSFLREFRKDQLHKVEWNLLSVLGRFGIVIRGTSFAFFGYYLMKVLWLNNPAYAKGSKEVLGLIVRQPFGPIWLAVAAFGFLSYAFYCLLNAKARRFS